MRDHSKGAGRKNSLAKESHEGMRAVGLKGGFRKKREKPCLQKGPPKKKKSGALIRERE